MTDTAVTRKSLDTHLGWSSGAQLFYTHLTGLEAQVRDQVGSEFRPFLTQDLIDRNVEGVYGKDDKNTGARIQKRYHRDVADLITNTAREMVLGSQFKNNVPSFRAEIAGYTLIGLVDACAEAYKIEPVKKKLVPKWIDQGVKMIDSEVRAYNKEVKAKRKKGEPIDAAADEASTAAIFQKASEYFSFKEWSNGRKAFEALVQEKSVYARTKESLQSLHPLDATRKYATQAWEAMAKAGKSVRNSIEDNYREVDGRKTAKIAGYTILGFGLAAALWNYGPRMYDAVSSKAKGAISGAQETFGAKEKLNTLERTLAGSPYFTGVTWTNGTPQLNGAPGRMLVDINNDGEFNDYDGQPATVNDLLNMYSEASERPREIVKEVSVEVRVPAELSTAACANYCPKPKAAPVTAKVEPPAPVVPPALVPPVAETKPFKKPY